MQVLMQMHCQQRCCCAHNKGKRRLLEPSQAKRRSLGSVMV
jgi:hypothetical protein